jgi:tRNA(fMet)-specific endonuclease VapC
MFRARLWLSPPSYVAPPPAAACHSVPAGLAEVAGVPGRMERIDAGQESLLRNKPAGVRERYREAEASKVRLALSSVVLFELWSGVAKSAQAPENTERLRILLSGDLDLLAVDDEDARTAGRVRVALEKAGTPIGAYDLLIAGQALRRGLTVVTANVSEFSRVTGLSWEDWTS